MSSREEVFPLHAEDGPSPSRSTDGRGRVWRCALPLTWESTELFRCALTWPGNTRPAAATPTGRRQPPPAAPPRQPPPVAPTAGITTGNAAEAITHRQRRRGNHPPATPPRQSPTGNAAEATPSAAPPTTTSLRDRHAPARAPIAGDRRSPPDCRGVRLWRQTVVGSDSCGVRRLRGHLDTLTRVSPVVASGCSWLSDGRRNATKDKPGLHVGRARAQASTGVLAKGAEPKAGSADPIARRPPAPALGSCARVRAPGLMRPGHAPGLWHPGLRRHPGS